MAPEASSMADLEEQQQKSSNAVGWSDLHPELLAEIFRRLDFVDYTGCLSVCASWRSIPERTMNFCKPNKDRQLPWLLISSPHDKPGCLSCFRTKRAFGRCIGSSQGFLITAHCFRKCSAMNPLTGACFPLPPTATHPDILLYYASHPNAPPTLIRPDDHTYDVCSSYQKAAISPSLDTIAVSTRGTAYVRGGTANVWGPVRYFSNLAYARAGDDSWTALVPPGNWRRQEFVADFIFHKGSLYVLYLNGYVLVFNLANPANPPLVSPRMLERASSYRGAYMTETPDGQDLLLLLISFTIPTLVVFRLDKNKLEWNRVQSIGDVALFVDGLHLSSLSTREFPCLKSNCVYFTTGLGWLGDNFNQIGVYELEDGSIHPLSPDGKLGGFRSSIVWFTPAL